MNDAPLVSAYTGLTLSAVSLIIAAPIDMTQGRVRVLVAAAFSTVVAARLEALRTNTSSTCQSAEWIVFAIVIATAVLYLVGIAISNDRRTRNERSVRVASACTATGFFFALFSVMCATLDAV